MLIITGASASGKSAVLELLAKEGFSKVTTCTTRPPRDGEADGKDYFFLTDEEFAAKRAAGEFAESAAYRGWSYGTPKSECGKPRACAALTPAGARALKAAGIDALCAYLKVDRRTRLIAALKRGDDVDEACRRSLSDEGQFDAFEREADVTIENYGHEAGPEAVAAFLASYYRAWEKSRGIAAPEEGGAE